MKSGTSLIVLIALMVSPCFASSHFASSQIQLSHIQRHTEAALLNARKQILEHLTPSERLVQQQSSITVPASYALVAHAYPGNIVISSGTYWILEQLAMAHIAEFELGFTGCSKDYSTHIARGISSKTRHAEPGQRQPAYLSLRAYAADFGAGCSSFSTTAIDANVFGAKFERLMDASVMLIYLHELGHHVLGHFDRVSADPEYNRRLEAAADAWAIEAAYRSELNILDGVPAFNLIAALGGATLEAEQKKWHPLGGRRVRDMMRQAREILANKGRNHIE